MNCNIKLLKKHENKSTNTIKLKTMGPLAGAAISAGMGLLLEGHNDRRQMEQQERLQGLQIQGQKQMTDYNYQKQLQMWKDTGYEAQMKQMKEAGLNPALMYGKGGAGGMTVGSGGGGAVGGAAAPAGGMEVMNMMMQKAQIALMEAQTKKTTVEAEKTAGVDTKLGETQIQSLTQGISSAKSQQALTEVQTAIASIDEYVKGKTQNMAVSTIMKNLQILTNDETISNETKMDKIKMVAAELSNKLMDTLNKQKQTAKSQQEIEEITTKIKLMEQQYSINKIDEEMANDGMNPKAGNMLRLIHNMFRGIAQTLGL